jgi:hypothetical protein
VTGTVIGAGAVVALPLCTLQLVVAVCVLAAVVASVAVRLPVTPGPANLSAVGVISGVVGTTAAVGGPPIALLYQHAPARGSARRWRCTSCSARRCHWSRWRSPVRSRVTRWY